jgi:pyrroline-5-carboxylate reductase
MACMSQADAYTVGFIGGGNMGGALIGGLIGGGVPSARITVAEPDAGKRAELARRYGIATIDDNRAVLAADIVVLAVKPQVMRSVAEHLAGHAAGANLVYLSIAAGIRCADLARWLGGAPAIVRAMPNTPALVGAGATALYANAAVTATQRALAQTVMRAVGSADWVVEERLIDAVTAISGSGPAYYFLVMEILERAGIRLGIAPAVARQLSLGTAFGAAKMALESGADPATLRVQVTSPGGTTEAALAAFAARDLESVLNAGVDAAVARAAALAREFGQ